MRVHFEDVGSNDIHLTLIEPEFSQQNEKTIYAIDTTIYTPILVTMAVLVLFFFFLKMVLTPWRESRSELLVTTVVV
jgi:type VI protein secretion system component VasF